VREGAQREIGLELAAQLRDEGLPHETARRVVREGEVDRTVEELLDLLLVTFLGLRRAGQDRNALVISHKLLLPLSKSIIDSNSIPDFFQTHEQKPVEESKRTPQGVLYCVSVYFLLFFPHCSHATSAGLARKIDEYVPATIPTINASANGFVESPPKKKMAHKLSKVVMDVLRDRLMV